MKRKIYDDWISGFQKDLHNLKQAKLRFILRRSKSLGWYIFDKEDNGKVDDN